MYSSQQIQLKGKPLDIEIILDQVITYKNGKNQILLQKFNVEYVVSLIERDKISQMEKMFQGYSKKGVDIIDFVRIFLNLI